MPELSVTEEQLERLDALRGEIEAAFVDGYGHVRRRDVVDYLLDTHVPPVEERVRAALDREVLDEEGDIDYPALQSIARNTDGVRGSGIGAEEMYEAVLEAKVRAVDPGAVEGLDVRTPGGEERSTTDGRRERRGSAGPAADDRTGATPGGDDTDDAGAGSSTGDDADETGSSAAAGGGSQLRAMMDLLVTHDDKWREAAGDAPYEVDLPDGGTEPARTKDDVKRILFTNY